MISQKDKRYIELALKQALKSDMWHRLGAVVVQGGRIMGLGANLSSGQKHAEFRALSQNWKSELKGGTLYVARATRCQRHGLSRPCFKCQELIRKIGISRVVFTTDSLENPIDVMYF
jgi:diaminohydroxyphosphoribosylaminopyrimidine deaminase/5-amino-6-(5-phosphoribosylamino)uracil reductase